MLLLFTAIGRLQSRPWNPHKATFLETTFPETRLEVVLPRDSGLFTSIVWIAGKQFVLENEGIPVICEFATMSLASCTSHIGGMIRRNRILAVCFCNVEHDSCIARQIPASILTRGPLACKSRATQGFDVEIAMESACAAVTFEERLHSTDLAYLEAEKHTYCHSSYL